MTISPFDRSDIAARPGPRYRAIADALRAPVKIRTLPPGTTPHLTRHPAYQP